MTRRESIIQRIAELRGTSALVLRKLVKILDEIDSPRCDLAHAGNERTGRPALPPNAGLLSYEDRLSE